MSNLFEKAKAAKQPEAPKAAKADKKLHVTMPGLEQLAQVDALVDALTGLKKTMEVDLKTIGFDKFMELASNGVQPENFRGTDGDASASVEMRKRATSSPLTPEQQQILKDAGVPFEKKVTVEECFRINPKYLNDSTLLEKISKAIGTIAPKDFIEHQAEASTMVVTDATLETAFAKKSSPDVLSMLTVMALKPKLEVTNYDKLFDTVKALVLGEKPKATVAVEAKPAKKAKAKVSA